MVVAIFGTFALEVDEDGYSALRKARLKALREELDEMSNDEREDGEGDDVVEIKDEREMELEKKKAALKDEEKIKAVVGEANDNDVADDVEEEEEDGEEEDEGKEDKEEFGESSENTPKNGGDASEAALEEVDEEEIDPAKEDDEENDEEKDEKMAWQERKIRCGRSCQAIWRKARVQVKALESEENSSVLKSKEEIEDDDDYDDDGDEKSSKRRDRLMKVAVSQMADKGSDGIRRRVRVRTSHKRNNEDDGPIALSTKKNSSKRKKKGRPPRIKKRKKKKWRVNWKKRKKFEGGQRVDCRRAEGLESCDKTQGESCG